MARTFRKQVMVRNDQMTDLALDIRSKKMRQDNRKVVSNSISEMLEDQKLDAKEQKELDDAAYIDENWYDDTLDWGEYDDLSYDNDDYGDDDFDWEKLSNYY